MHPQEFVLAPRLRLGMAVYSQAGPCPACHQHSNMLGVHTMNCGSGEERISRHRHLRNHLHEVAVAASLGPFKEVRFLIQGEYSRPDDVYIPQFAAGLDATIDVTVVNPLQRATVAGRPPQLAMPPPTPTRERCGERGRPAGGMALPSFR